MPTPTTHSRIDGVKVVLIVCATLFFVVLNSSGVTVILPDLSAAFSVNAGQLSWVMSGYLLTYWIPNTILPRDIPLAHQQGQQCVITQLPMVVEILIAKRNPIEPLRYQFLHTVFNARRIAVIHKARDTRAVTPVRLSTSRKRTPSASELMRPPSNRPVTWPRQRA